MGQGMAVRRRKGQPYRPTVEYRPITGPTLERLAKAGDAVSIGGDERTGKIIRVLDSPLDRMLTKRMVDGREYAALDKLRHHWWHANLSGAVRSPDLNRTWATDMTAFSHMPRSEREAHHRGQFRQAMALFDHLTGIVVTNALFSELPLHLCVPVIAQTSDKSQREKAKARLCTAADLLIRHWGL